MLVQYYYKKISSNNDPQLHFGRPFHQPAFSWPHQLSPIPIPLSLRRQPANNDGGESQKGAGGSKRPYEATF